MRIQVDQIIRSRRKTLALIVERDGSLTVRAPLKLAEESILKFVEKKSRWIEKKRAQAVASVPMPRQYLPGEMFMFLGDAYPLAIVNAQEKDLILDDSFKLAARARANAVLAFEEWYRAQAKCILNERVSFYAGLHGFQYRKLGITAARTRWGSCSANGSLNFSWRLIMAPMEVVDYVVVHELVHTVLHNHSKGFWGRVEAILSDYRERRKWLRENGSQLLI